MHVLSTFRPHAARAIMTDNAIAPTDRAFHLNRIASSSL
jgi:hypothetical protein